MSIWLDVTTTLGWGRPALGIVRVEAETARYFLTIENLSVRFCRFDYAAGSYFEVTCDEISAALMRLDAGGACVMPSYPSGLSETTTAKEAKSIEDRLKKLAKGAISLVPVRYRGKATQLAQAGRRAILSLQSKDLKNGDVADSQEINTKIPMQFVDEALPLPRTLPRGFVQPFDAEDVYVSLGLDWDQKNMSFLYELKKRLRLKILLFCYDIIPIRLPQHCAAGVPDKFPGYFADVAWSADKILCISEFSRKDLAEYLETVGAPVPSLDVVRLGSNILAEVDSPPSPIIEEFLADRFVLFVSTIESRKNHNVLYRAYKQLLEEGYEDLPLLVFVGMQGWGVENLISTLQSDTQIRPYIQILDHVSDSDLVHLYRNCEFTVYPSLYEGWGLPVAESLAYGKFCLASSAASIPEVGGDLIEYVDPLDESTWAKRLLCYIQNPDAVADREASIVQHYHHMSWGQTGNSILNAAQNLATE